MKDKILALAKTMYAGLGFTEKEFEALATSLEPFVKTDAEVEPAVKGAETMLKAFSSYSESRVTNGVKTAIDKYKAENPEGPKTEEPKKVDPPANETPTEKMIRELGELVKSQNDLLLKQSERIAKIEGGETSKTRAEQVNSLIDKANPAFKKTALDMFDFVKDADDTKFTAFMDKIKTGMTEFTQSLTEQGLTQVKGPEIVGVLPANGSDAGGNSFVDNMKALRESREAANKAKEVAVNPSV